MAEPVRVLIVDDSAFVRTAIRAALTTHHAIQVVGFAADGVEALAQIQKLRPDVVTLDIEMPRMNGLQTIEQMMKKCPTPTIMVSDYSGPGAEATEAALRLGAVDCMPKPRGDTATGRAAFNSLLVSKVLSARRERNTSPGALDSARAVALSTRRSGDWVVAIGISAGGPQTLTKMLPAFPEDFAPIVITQHMPVNFTALFAKSLSAVTRMKTREVQDGDAIAPGTIYIARGGYHLRFRMLGGRLTARLDNGPEVSGHRPSADAMFESLCQVCPTRVIAVVMTGMGGDGARGFAMLKRAGAHTIAQDEATSLVYGMPKVAAETGCADEIVPMQQIPRSIERAMTRQPAGAAF